MSCQPEANKARRHSLGAVPLLAIPENVVYLQQQDDDMVVEIGSYQTSIFTVDSQSQSTETHSLSAGISRPRSAPVDSDTIGPITSLLAPPLPSQD